MGAFLRGPALLKLHNVSWVVRLTIIWGLVALVIEVLCVAVPHRIGEVDSLELWALMPALPLGWFTFFEANRYARVVWRAALRNRPKPRVYPGLRGPMVVLLLGALNVLAVRYHSRYEIGAPVRTSTGFELVGGESPTRTLSLDEFLDYRANEQKRNAATVAMIAFTLVALTQSIRSRAEAFGDVVLERRRK